MSPPRSGPPSGGCSALIEMVNESPVPDASSSFTFTVNVQGAPLLVQVPPKVAISPVIVNKSNVTLCTFAPLAWLTYCRSPLIGPLVDFASTMKPKLAMPPETLTVPPPVTLPTVGGGGSTASVIFATKASLVPPPNVVWNAPVGVGKLVELVRPTT